MNRSVFETDHLPAKVLCEKSIGNWKGFCFCFVCVKELDWGKLKVSEKDIKLYVGANFRNFFNKMLFLLF